MKRFGYLLCLIASSAYGYTECDDSFLWRVPCSINVQTGVPLLGTWDFTNATVLGIGGGSTCITCSGNDGQVAIWNAASSKFIAGDPIVSGPDAPGSPPTKNPVQVGFFDGTNVQRGKSDTSGNLGVNVQNFPATQPVSGTVTANQGGSWTVTANAGTNLNTSSLALDTSVNGILLSQGSTTSGQKGDLIQGAVTTSAPSYTTAQTDPLSLNTSGGLRVDGSGVTQPVSGTVTANQGGSWTVTANAGTNLNTSALALESGGNLATIATNLNLAQASTTSGQKANLILGAVTTSAPSYTTAQSDPLSLNTSGGLRVDGSGVTQPVSGTITANAGTGNFSENLAQVNGSTVVTGATGIQKVAVSGATGLTLDAPIAGTTSAPANALVAGGVYNNAVPITPTDTDGAAIQLDQQGNQRVFSGIALKTLSAQGTALNSAQTIFSFSGAPAVLVQLVQTTTITAGAITFEVSYDAGANWFSMTANSVLDPTTNNYPNIPLPYTLQASTNKEFLLLSGGAQQMRIRTSTAITGTGTVTPNYALLNYNPVTTVTLANGANVNQNVNVNQIAGTSPSVASSGHLNVNAFGNQGGAYDAVTANAVPANAVQMGGRAATANPTNATGGNLTGVMLDKAGRVVTTTGHVRDLVGIQQTAITASATETTIVTAGASGVFNDLTELIITNSGSATCNWTLRDSTAGTIRAIYDMPATVGTGSLVIQFNPPLPQATAANNWTLQCSTATSTGAHIQAVFIKNT